ncbi:MAG TPA: N-acetylmuramoyl-L-alanine amidase [Woeseiaceae bacterium]|nr:N-acetylmuramoyl-L-alanine amidase [Woeseiaceae bacterium]
MARLHLPIALFFLCFAVTATAGPTVKNIRVWSEEGKTRVVLDLSGPAAHNIFTLRGPDRLVVDVKNGRLADSLRKLPGGIGTVRSIRSAVQADGDLRVVLDLNQAVRSRSFTVAPNNTYGDRLVIDLHKSGVPQAVKRASETFTRGRDIVIAIDPGHGGKDPGAIGKNRTREKDVALAISRALAARVNAEAGMRAILIRDGDYYVEHRRRMQIAHESKADLFISVHADAVKDRGPRGTTVYALSLKGASDEAARQLAARENASIGGVSLQDKDDVLASVLLDLSQNASLSASLDVGSSVIQELAGIGKAHRRTVQQAGLLVLKSPDIPSILVETGFISNPTEEQHLRDGNYQGRLASAMLSGIRAYFYQNPPPDTQIALNVRKYPAEQVRHVISRGDTLSEIAARYNVSAAAIRAANKMSSDSVRIGQTLAIPVYSSSGG